jgi:hypothetical protein
MNNDGVPYGFRMAVEHFSKPPPRDAFDRILQETNAKLDKLLKHTCIRISHLSAQDYERSRTILED